MITPTPIEALLTIGSFIGFVLLGTAMSLAIINSVYDEFGPIANYIIVIVPPILFAIIWYLVVSYIAGV